MKKKDVKARTHKLDKLVGKYIKIRRKQLGHTQKFYSTHLGISYQQFQKYENGRSSIRHTMLLIVAELQGIEDLAFYQGRVEIQYSLTNLEI